MWKLYGFFRVDFARFLALIACTSLVLWLCVGSDKVGGGVCARVCVDRGLRLHWAVREALVKIYRLIQLPVHSLSHTHTHTGTHTVLGSSSSQRRNNHSFSCLVRGFQTPSLSFSGPILDFFYISLDFSLSIMRGYIVLWFLRLASSLNYLILN